jgi:hypothetical protein
MNEDIEEEFDFEPLFDSTSFPFLMEDKNVAFLVTKYSKKRFNGFQCLHGIVVHLNRYAEDVIGNQKKFHMIGYEGSFGNPNSKKRRRYNNGNGWSKVLTDVDKFSEEEKDLVKKIVLEGTYVVSDKIAEKIELPPK